MKEKVTTLAEAVSRIPPHSRIALGGNIMRRQSLAAVREMVRQGIGDLTVYAFANGMSVDILASAGLLKRYEGVYAGLFWYGLASSFRRQVEDGAVEVIDMSESAITARFAAAAAGSTFAPVRALLGTDMARQGPDVLAEIACPFTGKPYVAVRAFEPDFTVMHAYAADRFGNVQWPLARDTDDIDQIIARGSKRLIVTVERIVDPAEILKTPNLTFIPGEWVEAVVEAPFGAHPLACDTIYNEDDDAMRAYASGTRSADGAAEYLRKYVHEAPSHEDYLSLFGGTAVLSDRLGVGGVNGAE